MGIRGLLSLIRRFSPDSIKVYDFGFYKNSIIAIDTSILLYKFRYSDDHINGFLKKCMKYISSGIVPIFVFDGKPPKEKNETLLRRQLKKEKLVSKIKTLELELMEDSFNESIKNNISRLSKQNIIITKEHREESKELLELLGFNVISSIGEAESICAFLQEKNFVDFTFTDDSDAFPLGCKKILRSNDNDTFVEINLETVLNGLKLNYDEFVDLCILCGCDYCPTIPKIGHITAYNLIYKYKTIESVLENIKDTYNVPEHFPFQETRILFRNKPVFDFSHKKIQPNDEKVRKFLLDRNYNSDFITNYLRKFNEKINKLV